LIQNILILFGGKYHEGNNKEDHQRIRSGIALSYAGGYLFGRTYMDKTPTAIDIVGDDDVNDKIADFKAIVVEDETDKNGDPELTILK
jgi:hypothetical protein